MSAELDAANDLVRQATALLDEAHRVCVCTNARIDAVINAAGLDPTDCTNPLLLKAAIEAMIGTPVTTPNQPPNAVADGLTTSVGTAVTVNPILNDSDPDGDALTLQSYTQPVNGTVTRSGDVLTYTPDSGFSGNDVFNYVVADSEGNTRTGNVSVTVGDGFVVL